MKPNTSVGQRVFEWVKESGTERVSRGDLQYTGVLCGAFLRRTELA